MLIVKITIPANNGNTNTHHSGKKISAICLMAKMVTAEKDRHGAGKITIRKLYSPRM
jgi:hypothetical protein